MMRTKLNLVALAAALGTAACSGNNFESNVKIVNGDVSRVFDNGYCTYGEGKMKELFKEAYPTSNLNKAESIIYNLHEAPMGSALFMEEQAPIVRKFWNLTLEDTLRTIKQLTETCEEVSTQALLAKIASMHGIGSASMEALEESISRNEEKQYKLREQENEKEELSYLRRRDKENETRIESLEECLNNAEHRAEQQEVVITENRRIIEELERELRFQKERGDSLERKLDEKASELGIAQISIQDLTQLNEEKSQQVERLSARVEEYKKAYNSKVEAVFELTGAFERFGRVNEDADINFAEVAGLSRIRSGGFSRSL